MTAEEQKQSREFKRQSELLRWRREKAWELYIELRGKVEGTAEAKDLAVSAWVQTDIFLSADPNPTPVTQLSTQETPCPKTEPSTTETTTKD